MRRKKTCRVIDRPDLRALSPIGQAEAAISLVNGAYGLVLAYKPTSPAQAKWREDWLAEAKRLGARLDT